ncbi:MAG: hypothetical protein DCC67_17090 [Planctomycetota bacterium]|nr:MAG: hypothetical protein DCC67_17090 [Planctomycetota bacterium]
MARMHGKRRTLSGGMESLEDRRMMATYAADMLLGETADASSDAAPAALAAATLLDADSQPDFWIDPAAGASLDGPFKQVEQALAEAHRQTGWQYVRTNYGLIGRGQTVAVIDSGIAYDHLDLGGGFGADYRVVAGWDFSENDADPYDDGASGGHGTHVAGIIGNDSAVHRGVAPGVDLVSLRVFNDAGQGYFSWVEKALRWVYENRNSLTHPITAVNLSLGVSSWNSATAPKWASLEDEFAQLESAGVFIAVSAGNSFASYKQPGLSYPAASQYVVPVMATDDGGQLSSFSQRLDRAIAAPGRGITSTVPDYKGDRDGLGDDFASMSGTSMAAPYVAAASVLIREAMELVGNTGVTQDAIYDHMLATADTVFDSFTNLSFKRLNLQAAIDALMPADDYGSSLESAEDLGTLAGALSVSGAIGTPGDADYFRFTAKSSGVVTLQATTVSGHLAPTWQAYDTAGDAIAAGQGSGLSFAVTAGQSYVVQLASIGGAGNYAFEATLQPAFTYDDWGSVAWNEIDDVAVNGERWHRLAASRDGLLTIQGWTAADAAVLALEVYDDGGRLVGASTSAGGVVRVDVSAAAGQQFFVKAASRGGSVNFTLANVLSQSESTVTLWGTDGDDSFMFAGGATTHEVAINGITYALPAHEASRWVIHGGGGNNAITLHGSAGDDLATLRVGSATLVGATCDAIVDGFASIDVHGGGGFDRAVMHDSAGHDEYRSWADRASLRGTGFANRAHGFDDYRAIASGGYDRAYLYDSAGDDLYTARPGRAAMSTGGHTSTAEGFDLAWAFATSGIDRATLYDSSGDDAYRSWPDRAEMLGPGYALHANGFDLYEAVSSAGDDRAVLNDSAGHDVFRTYADRAQMKTSISTSQAYNFRQATGLASGGYDRAVFYDTAYDDVVEVRSWGVALANSQLRNEARGFEYAAAITTLGNDTIDAEAVDFLFERIGTWR